MTKKHIQDELFITSEYVRMALEMLTEKGFDQDFVLQGIDLPSETLETSDYKVPFKIFSQLMGRALELTQDRTLAFQLGARLNLTTHGFLGYAAMSSHHLKDAVELAVKYFRTRTTLFDLDFFVDGEDGVIQINEVIPMNDHLRFALECLLTSFSVMGNKLIPEEMRQRIEQEFGITPETHGGEVRVTYARPDYYDKLDFESEINFRYECSNNQIRFPAKLLNLELGHSDPRLSKMAAHQCEEQLQHINGENSMLYQVRRIIEKDNGQSASLERVAQELNVSSRTLKRRLKALDTSYQRILDGVRKGKAIEFLTSTSMTVDEIADSLGYSDPSNFGRAFRKWTGKSPTEYRVH